jgi:uncharacterized coiled-coil DUF342 family protein
MDNQLNEIKKILFEFQKDIKCLREETRELREETRELREETRELREETDELIKNIFGLRAEINNLSTTCGRMDDHISFVDSVYDNIRHPMQSIGKRIFSNFTLPDSNPNNTALLVNKK